MPAGGLAAAAGASAAAAPAPPGEAGPALALRPPTATVDRSLTVSSCPAGQEHGAEDSLIGRVISNVEPQARQRYS